MIAIGLRTVCRSEHKMDIQTYCVNKTLKNKNTNTFKFLAPKFLKSYEGIHEIHKSGEICSPIYLVTLALAYST